MVSIDGLVSQKNNDKRYAFYQRNGNEFQGMIQNRLRKHVWRGAYLALHGIGDLHGQFYCC